MVIIHTITSDRSVTHACHFILQSESQAANKSLFCEKAQRAAVRYKMQ